MLRSSKYIGVSYRKSYRRWVASISIDKKRVYIGSFTDERQAARMVDITLIRYGKKPKNLFKPV